MLFNEAKFCFWVKPSFDLGTTTYTEPMKQLLQHKDHCIISFNILNWTGHYKTMSDYQSIPYCLMLIKSHDKYLQVPSTIEKMLIEYLFTTIIPYLCGNQPLARSLCLGCNIYKIELFKRLVVCGSMTMCHSID